MLGEVLKVLVIQGRQRMLPNEAARRDPCVVLWTWATANLGMRLQLAPALSYAAAVRQDGNLSQERVQRVALLGPNAGTQST